MRITTRSIYITTRCMYIMDNDDIFDYVGKEWNVDDLYLLNLIVGVVLVC